VTNAGGLGVLGELAHAPEQIAQDIAWLRERVGDKPFGVDLIFPASLPEKAPSLEERRQVITQEHRDFVQQFMEQHHLPEPASTRGSDAAVPIGMSSLDDARRQLDVLLEERVPLIAAGLGSPAFVLDAAHARGIKVAGLVGRTRQARREIEAGVDIIIAQGYDGGGHTGEIGTFTLVPQVVAIAGDTPVLCAGGVGTGRHLAAALCFGAAGVWSGTLWLASRESDSSLLVKEKILASTEDDTIRSRALTGKPARQLKSAWNLAWEAPDAPPPLPFPLQMVLSGRIMAAARETNDPALAGSPAGQVIGTIDAIKPCREIIYDMVEEARDVFDSLLGVPVA